MTLYMYLSLRSNHASFTPLSHMHVPSVGVYVHMCTGVCTRVQMGRDGGGCVLPHLLEIGTLKSLDSGCFSTLLLLSQSKAELESREMARGGGVGCLLCKNE